MWRWPRRSPESQACGAREAKSRDAAVEASQLGQARQEHGGGDGANALDGAQAGGGLRQGRAVRKVVRHLALDQQEVGLEHAQVTGDVPAQIGGRGLSQTVGFGPGHGHEVLPARQQRGKTLPLGVGGRAGREGERPPHLGQHAGIHPVGLGQPTGGASKVAGLPGIDHTIGDAGAGQSVKKRPLVAARRLQHDQAGAGASRKAPAPAWSSARVPVGRWTAGGRRSSPWRHPRR